MHELRCKAKIRYRHPEQWATVTPVGGATPFTSSLMSRSAR